MAIPSITNNSPSAGSIAWGAFNIQLNGVTYSVAAGSTSSRWVWWKYNNGAPTIVGGAEVPDTLVDDDLVLFANKNGIGVRVQSTSFIDGELLVDGSIFADALSTNLINSQHIVTAGLDAGVIKFGVMSGDRIDANTVTAEKLTVGSLGGDLVRNGGFEDVGYWTLGPNATRLAAAALTGGWGMRLTASGSPGLTSAQFPVGPGDVLAVVGDAKGVVATTGLYFRISWRNAAGAQISTSDPVSNKALTVGTWAAQAAATAAAPAGTVGAVLQVFNTTGTADVDDISVRKVIVSAQIGDGQILAPKIKAGEINSQHVVTLGLDAAVIKFGVMSGDRITANTINTNHVVTTGLDAAVIKFGTMSGDRITANTLNSGHIATVGLDASVIKFGLMSGARISAGTISSGHIATAGLDAAVIKFGTMSGDRITADTITAAQINFTNMNGEEITGALVRTAASSTRVELRNAPNPFVSNQTWGMLQFYNSMDAHPTTPWYPGQMWGQFDPAGSGTTDDIGQVSITSPFPTYSGMTAANAARIDLQTFGDGTSQMDLTADDLNIIGDTVTFNAASMQLYSSAGSFDFNTYNTNEVLFRQGSGSQQGLRVNYGTVGEVLVRTRSSSTQPRLLLDGLGISLLAGGPGIYANGTVTWNSYTGSGGATNLQVGNSGVMTRATSSRRYKKNLQEIVFTPAKAERILDLVPYLYEDIVQDDGIIYPGFMAEDAHALGLHPWVVYENIEQEDGSFERLPDGFHYDKFAAVAHQIILRELRDRIKAQAVQNNTRKTEIADLKTEVAALRAMITK